MKRSQKTILVTDAERGSALSFIRSAGRAGYRVVAASKARDAVSFRSRYTADFRIYPDPHVDPELFTEAVLETLHRLEIDLVVPITEESVIPLAKARSRFPADTQLAIAQADALETALNKRRTLECAEALGIPCPQSHFVRSISDLEQVERELKWPVVVKPQFSLARTGNLELLEECKISYASSRQQIEKRIRTASERYGFLLQEYCGGRGIGIELLVWQGVVQAAFQHTRLAEVPVTGGASALRMSAVPDPVLLQHAQALVAKLGWTGLCMIEFRGEGARARLMEMNGRVWGSLPLAVQSGMDFPARMVKLMLGDATPSIGGDQIDTGYRTGHMAYNPDLLTVWFGSVLRGSNSAVPYPSRLDALRLVPACWRATSDLYDPNDPAPGRGTVRKQIRKIAAKLLSNSGNAR